MGWSLLVRDGLDTLGEGRELADLEAGAEDRKRNVVFPFRKKKGNSYLFKNSNTGMALCVCFYDTLKNWFSFFFFFFSFFFCLRCLFPVSPLDKPDHDEMRVSFVHPQTRPQLRTRLVYCDNTRARAQNVVHVVTGLQ